MESISVVSISAALPMTGMDISSVCLIKLSNAQKREPVSRLEIELLFCGQAFMIIRKVPTDVFSDAPVKERRSGLKLATASF